MPNTLLLVGIVGVFVVVVAAMAVILQRLAAAETARAVAVTEAKCNEQFAESRGAAERARVELELTATELVAAREALVRSQQEVLGARERIARQEAESGALAERIVELNNAREQMREAFQTLSTEALRGNNEAFLQLARTELERAREETRVDLTQRQSAIESLVTPIRDGLAANEAKLHEIEKDRIESFGRLMNEVAGVATASERLRSETVALSRALHSTNARGSWGELQLRRVCELAGMLEHCDFTTQDTVQGETGALRPDLIVRLPGGRTIVVDAKAPATAFLEAAACDEPGRQSELLKEHAAQVKKQVDLLSKKSYWEQFDNAPDFVVLFLPNDAFYSEAIRHEPELLEYAVQQRVLIATPVSLIGLLKVVALGWRQERIAESAQSVSDAGRELYDRLRKMTEHFEKIGINLHKAVDAYNSAVGSMERSVFPKARMLEQLGAAGPKLIAEPEQVEVTPRVLAAPDWVAAPSNETVTRPAANSLDLA